jgi:hypothetical protein
MNAIQLGSKVCMEGCNHISLVKTSFSYGHNIIDFQ